MNKYNEQRVVVTAKPIENNEIPLRIYALNVQPVDDVIQHNDVNNYNDEIELQLKYYYNLFKCRNAIFHLLFCAIDCWFTITNYTDKCVFNEQNNLRPVFLLVLLSIIYNIFMICFIETNVILKCIHKIEVEPLYYKFSLQKFVLLHFFVNIFMVTLTSIFYWNKNANPCSGQLGQYLGYSLIFKINVYYCKLAVVLIQLYRKHLRRQMIHCTQ